MDRIEIEQYLEETRAENIFDAEDEFPGDKWKPTSDRVNESDDSSGFDCNICLDFVQDPVVTLCGHLYCWPCIYVWIHFRSVSTEFFDRQRCPVCKSEMSEDTLVPLFGHGHCTKSSENKAPNLGIIVPPRPLGLWRGFGSPRSLISQTTLNTNHTAYQHNYPYESQPDYALQGSRLGTTTHMSDPVFGMLYARVFGSSITNMYTYPYSYNVVGRTSPRARRHVMQADQSLGRICFFLFCCVFLCLLLF